MAEKSGDRRGQRATNEECDGIDAVSVLPRVAAACDEPAHAAATANATAAAASYAQLQDPDDRDNAEVVYFFFFQMPRTCAIWSNNQLGWFSEESSKGCAIW
jgi:hypothetical protein